MVRPSSRARKCLAEACRRTERPLATATDLILRPTTSRDRSWRSVSTSGSSGTGQTPPRPPGRPPARRPSSSAPRRCRARPANEHLGHVAPVVVGPEPHHHVAGRPLAVADGLLLQPALVVEVVGLLAGPLDGLAQLAEHELASRPPSRRRGRRPRGWPRRRRPGWTPWPGRRSLPRPGPAGGPRRRPAARPPRPGPGRSPRRSGPWPACPRRSRGSARSV